jgi:quercetin dioxygenase-like cupin family protein
MDALVPTLEKIEQIEARLLALPQVEVPVTNLFAAGLYWREITLDAGTFAIGHKHKQEHINVILTGRLRVLADGKVTEIVAPAVFKSGPGIRKVAYAVETTRWANVLANPTEESDVDKLEILFVEKSPAWLACAAEMKLLTDSI